MFQEPIDGHNAMNNKESYETDVHIRTYMNNAMENGESSSNKLNLLTYL